LGAVRRFVPPWRSSLHPDAVFRGVVPGIWQVGFNTLFHVAVPVFVLKSFANHRAGKSVSP
jgi:hypothetical protein